MASQQHITRNLKTSFPYSQLEPIIPFWMIIPCRLNCYRKPFEGFLNLILTIPTGLSSDRYPSLTWMLKSLRKFSPPISTPIISLIHKNQVGFIPSRQAVDYVWRATLLTHAALTRRIPACFMSLDISNAFDTLFWSYLHFILHRFGI